jgi:hypothetical protein
MLTPVSDPYMLHYRGRSFRQSLHGSGIEYKVNQKYGQKQRNFTFVLVFSFIMFTYVYKFYILLHIYAAVGKNILYFILSSPMGRILATELGLSSVTPASICVKKLS